MAQCSLDKFNADIARFQYDRWWNGAIGCTATTPKVNAMPEQIEIVCRNLDRLVTVEARISDYSRGVIANLYEAACAAQNGGPLSLNAARMVLRHARRGGTVLMTTGAGGPPHLPAGETDGPPGLAVLARAIHQATGATPLLFTEPDFVDNLSATALAAGLGLRDVDMARETPFGTAVLPLSGGDNAPSQAAEYLDRFKPDLLIAVEKIGPNEAGIAHTASGQPTRGERARAECLFEIAAERGIASIGIGDNGNEIGFGLISNAVKRYKPQGDKLATRVQTNALMTANTSNWGAYAIIAAMAAVTGNADLLHTPEMEQRVLEACVNARGVDGSTGRHILAVDGMPAEAQRAIVTLLGVIVRNGMVQGYKRPF